MQSSLCAVLNQTGAADVFSLEETAIKPLNANEVLLKHTAIGVNFIDTYYRAGLYDIDLPCVLGDEAIGIILQVGVGVSEFSVGQRVAYPTSKGAYCSIRTISCNDIVCVPDSLDDLTVAASLMRGMTVEYLFCRLYQLKAGETILIHAAAGGVGVIACQWAKAIGATVIGTVSSKLKADIARKNGCDYPIVYTEQDFYQEVLRITNGAKVDVVYDSVGKDTFEKSLDCLRPRGLMVSYGNASGKPEPLDVLSLSSRGSLFLTRPSLFHYTQDKDELRAGAKHYFSLLEKGVIKVDAGKAFPLTQVADAHRYLEDRNSLGTPVLIPS